MPKRNVNLGEEVRQQKGKVYAHIVLDMSGSMGRSQNNTIDAINGYVRSLREDENMETRLSLTLFRTGLINRVWDKLPLDRVPDLDLNTYRPNGGTPLYDAIGQVIDFIEREVELDADEGVSIVILTDGMENASTEHNSESIRNILDVRQNNDDWLVTYLGANQDAMEAGRQFGAAAGQTMTYDMNSIGQTMNAAARATMFKGRGMTNAQSAYTVGERMSAGGGVVLDKGSETVVVPDTVDTEESKGDTA